jgi:hypothetical protein
MSKELSREELSASLAARHELGQEYETALVDSLADRIEQVVSARVEARIASERPAPAPAPALSPRERIALGLGSIVLAIPCTAIAGDVGGVTGVFVVWVGIVAVNVAAGLSPGRGR